MSNQDIADALFVDEDDLTTVATQNELFKLLGVTDGDPRYSDVLLIADWHERKLKEAQLNEASKNLYHVRWLLNHSKPHAKNGLAVAERLLDERITELTKEQSDE